MLALGACCGCLLAGWVAGCLQVWRVSRWVGGGRVGGWVGIYKLRCLCARHALRCLRRPSSPPLLPSWPNAAEHPPHTHSEHPTPACPPARLPARPPFPSRRPASSPSWPTAAPAALTTRRAWSSSSRTPRQTRSWGCTSWAPTQVGAARCGCCALWVLRAGARCVGCCGALCGVLRGAVWLLGSRWVGAGTLCALRQHWDDWARPLFC